MISQVNGQMTDLIRNSIIISHTVAVVSKTDTGSALTCLLFNELHRIYTKLNGSVLMDWHL